MTRNTQHCTGSPLHRENWENGNKKHFLPRKTGNLEILPKHRGNIGNLAKTQGKHSEFCVLTNFLILKIKDMTIFADNFPFFPWKTELHMKHPQITEIGTGKYFG